MSLLQTFLKEVEEYIDRSGMTATAFGRATVGDPNFVFGLRDGREPRAGTIDKVREFMRATVPTGSAA